MKHLFYLPLLTLLPAAGYSQGWPTINSMTPVSDMRIGPDLGGNNTGILKWIGGTTNELGLFTWADGRPIRIGGSLVKFQHESGNANNVQILGNLGIGAAPGTSKLEITAATAGESGLKFTQLTSASTAGATNDKCLSVDNTGKVTLNGMHWATNGNNIYNTNTGGLSIGSSTLATGSRLSVTGLSNDLIGVKATMSAVAPGFQVDGFIADVQNNSVNEGFYGKTSGGIQSIGGNFEAKNASTLNAGVSALAQGGPISVGGTFIGQGSNNVAGVSAVCIADSSNGSAAKGGTFLAKGAVSSVGVNAEAYGTTGNVFNYGVNAAAFQYHGNYNYGVKSSAQTYEGATRNAGVYTIASVTGTTCTNYGVYSLISGGAPAANPPNGAGSYAGYFWDNSTSTNATGAAFFNGAVILGGGVTAISDRKFKEDIHPVDNAMAKVMQLAPVSYTFKSKTEFPSFTFPAGKQLGFIAQELEQIFPELVHESVNPAQYDDKGNKIADKVEFKGVDYTSLIPVLTKAIQEQQAQIEEQQKQIDELKTAIAKSATGTGHNNYSDGTSQSYLSQNVPNPFTQNTVIKYQLPADTKTAAIGLYDLNGNEVKLLTLGAEHAGSITIDGGSMQAGMYLYTLIINGMPLETKKMILTSR